jgi:hypothetical protein
MNTGFSNTRLTRVNENVSMAFGITYGTGAHADYGSAHIARLTMTGLPKPLGIEPELLAEEGAIGESAGWLKWREQALSRIQTHCE